MTNQLEVLLNEIQLKTRLTLEEIAGEIGFSRPYLNKMKKTGGNDKIVKLLHEKYEDILQNDTSLSDMQAQIAALKDDKKFLKKLLETNLSALHEEIKNNRELLVTIINSITARGDTVFEFLEEQGKKPPGSLVVKSDMKEIELKRKQNQRGRHDGVNNDGKK